jgi:hypothetical protein
MSFILESRDRARPACIKALSIVSGWKTTPDAYSDGIFHHTSPPPVGKAGFEVWVLTKGGLVSVQHCRLYRTVVHAHLVGSYDEP